MLAENRSMTFYVMCIAPDYALLQLRITSNF